MKIAGMQIQKLFQKFLLCLGLDRHVFDSKNQFLVLSLVKVEHDRRVKKQSEKSKNHTCKLIKKVIGDPVVPKEQVELDSEKFHYDGQEFGHHSGLKALKDLCREFEVSTTGSKKQILKRLSRASQERESGQSLAYSQRQFEARVQPLLRPRSKKPENQEETDLRNLTHLPFAPWREHYVARRNRENMRKKSEVVRSPRGANKVNSGVRLCAYLYIHIGVCLSGHSCCMRLVVKIVLRCPCREKRWSSKPQAHGGITHLLDNPIRIFGSEPQRRQ